MLRLCDWGEVARTEPRAQEARNKAGRRQVTSQWRVGVKLEADLCWELIICPL
jgi:hypothetical protein